MEVKIDHNNQIESYNNGLSSCLENEIAVYFWGKLKLEGNPSEIILKLYKKKGLEFAKDLRGYFAILIKDNHKLILIRDPIGLQPIYYLTNKTSLIFSNKFNNLFILAKQKTVNKNSALEFLEYITVPSKSETLINEIKRIEPNTINIFKKLKLFQSKSYFNFSRKTKSISEKDAFSTFKKLLESAIDFNLEKNKMNSFDFSGGIDSTGIIGIAKKINKNLKFQLLSNGLNEEQKKINKYIQDDSLLFNKIIENEKWPNTKIFSGNENLSLEEVFELETLGIPFKENYYFLYDKLNFIKSTGGSNLISGFGGDECITFNQPPEPLQKAMEDINISKYVYYLNIYGLKRVFITTVNYLFSNSKLLKKHPPKFILPNITKRKTRKIKMPNIINEHIINMVTGPNVTLRVESEKEYASNFNINMAYPFLDLELIEFFLQLPDKFKFYHKIGRQFYKKSIESYFNNTDWLYLRKSKTSTLPISKLISYLEFNKNAFDLDRSLKKAPLFIQEEVLPLPKPISFNSFEYKIYSTLSKRIEILNYIFEKYNINTH